MFSPLGKYIINTISIFDDLFMNLIACSIIGLIAYTISYSITGSAYANGLISSRAGGSLVHWLIRIPLFIVMAYLVRGGYFIYTFVQSIF